MRKKILVSQRKPDIVICKHAHIECLDARRCYNCQILDIILKEQNEKIESYSKKIKEIINIIKGEE